MKYIKYIGVVILIILIIGQVFPIYFISSGLIQNQVGDDSSYFLGKLTGHIFISILMTLIALKLYKSAKKHGNAMNKAHNKSLQSTAESGD